VKGSKTQIAPGVWRLRAYVGRRPNGTPIQASKTFHGGSRAADDELRRFVEQVGRSRSPDRAATLATVLEAWMDSRRRATPLTRAGDQGYIDRRIVPELGGIRLDRLNGRDLDRAYTRWLAEGLSPSTVQKMHSIISAALTQAVKWDMADRNVAKLATPPSRQQQPSRSIGQDELTRLIVKARADGDATLAMAVCLGAVTGARRGELLALRWSDLDETRATLTIGRSMSTLEGGRLESGPTKTHQVRRLIVDEQTVALLAWWRTGQADHAAAVGVPLVRDPYILAGQDRPRADRPVLPQTLSHQFTRLARSLDMPYHFHELRHFAATRMISSGIDPRMAATRLGHARPNITLEIYAHAVEAADRRAAELLGASLPALPS
jgi:integrase